MGMSSRMIRDRLSARPTFVTSLAAVADGKFVPVPGGVLIEDSTGLQLERLVSVETRRKKMNIVPFVRRRMQGYRLNRSK